MFATGEHKMSALNVHCVPVGVDASCPEGLARELLMNVALHCRSVEKTLRGLLSWPHLCHCQLLHAQELDEIGGSCRHCLHCASVYVCLCVLPSSILMICDANEHAGFLVTFVACPELPCFSIGLETGSVDPWVCY